MKPARILEVGAGWNRDFDDHFGSKLEYWMVDDSSEIGGDQGSIDKFERSMKSRTNTHFVRGLLGNFSKDLPDNYFDLVFSISVIEHVPFEFKTDFDRDMYRVVKPGGWIAHSIDLWDKKLAWIEFEMLRQAGLDCPPAPT